MADEMLTGFLAGQADSNNNCCNRGGGGWGDFGGIGGLIALAILAMLFGGGFGFGGGGFGGGMGGMMLNGIATRNDINAGFQFNDIQNGIRGIQQGICDSTYALNNSIMSGFHGVDNAICNLGFNVQQGFNTLGYQQKDCCCETQRLIERGFCDTNYNLANNTSAIVQAGHCDTDRVIAKLDAMEATRQAEKIEALRLENQTLRFQASQANQNAFITANQEAQTAELIRRLRTPEAVPAYVVPNPNCCYGNPLGVGYNYGGYSQGGCGCGCGC